MRSKINFKINTLDVDYSLFTLPTVIFTQDSTHIGTKLRNRLLKPSISLPFGRKAISVSHLKNLLSAAPYDIHGLVMNDIQPDDRQNFESLEKIMDIRVLNALKKYVIDSDATIIYLTICKNVTECYLNSDLSCLERVYKIWNSIFLLRIWRKFLLESKVYNIEDNFISSNAYACIELNGLALIKLIVSMRNEPELFLPTLFDSQTCEKTFRQLRSMGTINHTKINFTTMELLHMISRIEIQNDIVYNRLANIATFPRISINKPIQNTIVMPSNDEIKAIIQCALKDAIESSTKFGISSQESDVQTCELRETKVRLKKKEDVLELDSSDEDLGNFFLNRDENINLRGFDIGNISEASKYIQISNPDGSTKIVHKSSIVTLLSDTPEKLSTDRLKRVQGVPLQKTAKRQKKHKHDVSQNFATCNEIFIGDWCVFELDPECIPIINLPENAMKSKLIGSVLAFQFVNGKNEKEKQYHLESAVVVDENTEQRRNDLNILSSWYAVSNDDDSLISLGVSSSFHLNIKHYKCTTPMPSVTGDNCVSIENLRNQMNSL